MCLCCVRRLHSFLMQVANASVQGNHRASAIEICSCPVGYAGTSCEVCSDHASQHVSSFSELSLSCFCVIQACVPGFRRVNGKLYNGVCAACHCHGHASQCHEVTGHCLVRPGFSFCLWSPTSTHRCGFQLNKEILHLFLCGWCRQRLDYFGKINIAFKPAFLRQKSLFERTLFRLHTLCLRLKLSQWQPDTDAPPCVFWLRSNERMMLWSCRFRLRVCQNVFFQPGDIWSEKESDMKHDWHTHKHTCFQHCCYSLQNIRVK